MSTAEDPGLGKNPPLKDIRFPKLGKLAPKPDVRTLRLERYLPRELPPIPTAFDYGTGVTFPMWLNDREGDCVVATSAGWIDVWTTKQGKPHVLTDAEVGGKYSELTGFDPTTGMNDTGLVILDFLKDWRNNGFAGDKLGAYGDLGNANMSLIFAATYLCECLSIGVQLPDYCLQTDVWDRPSNRIAGGHNILLTGADGRGNALGRTWGGRKITLSPAFMGAQVDELHFAFSQDQLDGNGIAANHIALKDIQEDIATIGTFDTPPLVVPPPIVVPPPPIPPVDGLPPIQPTHHWGHAFWAPNATGFYFSAPKVPAGEPNTKTMP